MKNYTERMILNSPLVKKLKFFNLVQSIRSEKKSSNLGGQKSHITLDKSGHLSEGLILSDKM